MQIIGRRSSLFTRMALMLAEELRVPYELVPIYDMTELQTDVYAGNPALKLPTLRRGAHTLFGTLNICRAIAETVGKPTTIIWPEQLRDDISRNAQELVWHCMSAQVQILMGTVIGKLPADNVYFVKARTGVEGSLHWLDMHLQEALDALPRNRTLSIFELSLFCLTEHVEWRKTFDLHPYPALLQFTRAFAARTSARCTEYRFDSPPT